MNSPRTVRPRSQKSIQALAHSVLAELRKAGFGPDDQQRFVIALEQAQHESANVLKVA